MCIRDSMGCFLEASNDDMITNTNNERTHSCINLGPDGQRQGNILCFDLITGSVITRRIFKVFPWSNEWPKIANEWGRKGQ